MMVSAFGKFSSTADFGYNMYGYQKQDLVMKGISNRWFLMKCGSLFIVVILLYLIQFKDRDIFEAY